MRDGQALLAWLYRTVVNIVRDRAKSARRRPMRRFGDLANSRTGAHETKIEELADEALDPSRKLLAAERDRALERAIGDLPLEFREPLVLHHLQEMDVSEIADVLRLPVGTVKSRLSRGRAQLRDALASWFEG
jgi:RNA polymerase sigma-70 factor (ECF subfamily)